MSNFYARTRLRGTIDYYKAAWIDHGNHYLILFNEGPNAGKYFREDECAIALDEASKKKMNNE